MRIVRTCFGDFVISGRIATCKHDKDFYYHLPRHSFLMSNRSIRKFFEDLREFEQ